MLRAPLRFLLAVLVAFTLAACADEAEVEPVPEEPLLTEEPEPMEVPAAPAVDVQGTIDALQGGLLAVPMDAALQNIDGWMARLETETFDGADAVAERLGDLRSALTEAEVDGAEVGAILVDLGGMTMEAATAAGSAELDQLAGILTEAGQGLTGGM